MFNSAQLDGLRTGERSAYVGGVYSWVTVEGSAEEEGGEKSLVWYNFRRFVVFET